MAQPEPNGGVIAALARRDGAIVALCLAALAGVAWWRLLSLPMMPMASAWSASYLAAAFSMWALMMVAMMLPSAAPMILLHARFADRAAPGRAGLSTALFSGIYLAVWTGFSLAAAVAQAGLVASGAVSAMALKLGSAALAGVVLLLAGLYQLTPLKRACVAVCRSPLSFLMQHWRPGAAGALRLGLAHGLYCLGCCWALMLLLFVGGVMDLAWIAGLTLLVFVEKLAPPRLRATPLIGVALLVAGLYLLGSSRLASP